MEVLTQEQKQLQDDLRKQYGEIVCAQALQLSGLTLCLSALATEGMSEDQRTHLYKQASLHLAVLLETVMPAEHSAKVTECAKRMDAALDTWMADEIEQRDGLPAQGKPWKH